MGFPCNCEGAKDYNSYFLFKNAHNGSGCVKKYDDIRHVNVEWSLNDKQLDGVITMLQEQLGSGYKVVKPENKNTCIIIEVVD